MDYILLLSNMAKFYSCFALRSAVFLMYGSYYVLNSNAVIIKCFESGEI